MAHIWQSISQSVWDAIATELWETPREWWLANFNERMPHYNNPPPSLFDCLEHIVAGVVNGCSAETDNGYFAAHRVT